MRSSTDLLLRIFGQMDSSEENIRIVAFRKAHAMMQDHDLTFSHVLEIALAAAKVHGPSAQTAHEESDREWAQPTADKPYIHARRAGRFARRFQGKRVFRGTCPPIGITGRLRVLSDVEADVGYGYRKLKISFETADALYEAFELTRKDPTDLATIRRSSIEGIPFSFY